MVLIARGGRRIWCLPKGLIEPQEKEEQAALREVEEETGLTGRLLRKAGEIRYQYFLPEEKVRIQKKVTFFLLEHTGGDTSHHDFEVDEAAWFPWPKALRKLSYPKERELVEKAQRFLPP